MNFFKNSLIFGISISLVNKYVFSVLFYYNIQGYLAGQAIGFDFWISVAVLFSAASIFFFVFDIFFHNKFLYQYLISILLCFLSFHIFLDISDIPETFFSGLTSLESVMIRNNQLTDIPENIFNGITSLRRFSVQGNEQLANLPDLSKMLSLAYLEFGDTSIYTLESNSLQHLIFNQFSGKSL